MILLLCACFPSLAWAWGDLGHETIAYIAAAHLSANAQNHVAQILQADPNDASNVASAMANASIRPDVEFRNKFPVSRPWHFVDLCLQDTESNISQRCSNGCVTQKIDEYEGRLRRGEYDQFAADGDLAFLIHFVGDIHQPLHTATNADRGGNCVRVSPGGAQAELHATWDTTLVNDLERKLHVQGPEQLAVKLDSEYKANPPGSDLAWKSGGTNDVAWESTQVARSEIYNRLGLKTEECQAEFSSCRAAPEDVQSENIHLDSNYISRETDIVGRQLYIGGMRLASLLNQVWP